MIKLRYKISLSRSLSWVVLVALCLLWPSPDCIATTKSEINVMAEENFGFLPELSVRNIRHDNMTLAFRQTIQMKTDTLGRKAVVVERVDLVLINHENPDDTYNIEARNDTTVYALSHMDPSPGLMFGEILEIKQGKNDIRKIKNHLRIYDITANVTEPLDAAGIERALQKYVPFCNLTGQHIPLK